MFILDGLRCFAMTVSSTKIVSFMVFLYSKCINCGRVRIVRHQFRAREIPHKHYLTLKFMLPAVAATTSVS